MIFSATKEALIDSLSLCSSIAERRQTIPILSNILIRAEKGSFSLTATDLERQLKLYISEVDIEKSGETTVSARKLYELIRSVPIP